MRDCCCSERRLELVFGERDRSIDQSLAGMVKAWSGAGAWAAEAELADAASALAKEREVSKGVGVGGQDVFAFPSLGDAVSAKPQKKKKGQTFSLSEITVGKYVGPGGKARGAVVNDTTKLTTEEMMMLPTGPRARSDDEQAEVGALGGGFRDYGGNRGGGDRLDREERRDRGGFGLGFERDREGGGGGGGFGRDRERDDGPSRADEDAKWGASKKFVPSLGVGERGGGGDRGGGGYEEDKRGGRVSDRDLPSRADEVDNWGSSKKFVPASQTLGGETNGERRIISGRSEERRGSAGYDDAPGGGLTSRADEVDNWAKGKKFVPSSTSSSRGFGFDAAAFKDAAAGPEADRWARRQPAPESEQRASERPRLKLQPRTLPVDSSSPPPARIHETDGGKDSLTVLEGSVSEELQQQLSAAAVSKHRPDPFAGARTQEQVLAEKGLDWRKIDANLDVSKEKPWRQGKQPSSGESSKPHTPPEKGVETAVKPPPLRTNPFGEARQQEVLLEAKGKDLHGLDADPEQHVA